MRDSIDKTAMTLIITSFKAIYLEAYEVMSYKGVFKRLYKGSGKYSVIYI
jgi:hypothetical protein